MSRVVGIGLSLFASFGSHPSVAGWARKGVVENDGVRYGSFFLVLFVWGSNAEISVLDTVHTQARSRWFLGRAMGGAVWPAGG